MCLAFTDKSSWAVVPQGGVTSPLRLLELFAGGFGGWQAGLDFIGQHVDLKHQTLAVDHDDSAIKCYAVAHHAKLIPSSTHLPRHIDWGTDNWALQADIWDSQILPLLCDFDPKVVSMSAPCPPWSGAHTAEGVFQHDGLSFAKALLICKWIRPAEIWLEQVLGSTVMLTSVGSCALLNGLGTEYISRKFSTFPHMPTAKGYAG